jgi:hypothetical protein
MNEGAPSAHNRQKISTYDEKIKAFHQRSEAASLHGAMDRRYRRIRVKIQNSKEKICLFTVNIILRSILLF